MDTYTRIADAPLDPYDDDDVGDANPGDGKHLPPVPASAPAASMVIPFTREIRFLSRGRDTVGAKRALDKALGNKVSDTVAPVFGLFAVRKLKQFQTREGLAADGVLGPETLKKLAPSFDRYGFMLYTGYPPGGTNEDRMRKRIVAYALWGYNNRPAIGYAQFRPMQHMDSLYYLPRLEDCSTFGTKAYKSGEASDPNGMRPPYNGLGNTQTMRAHGAHIPVSMMKLGDLVHYDDPQHVAVYVGTGRVISHGSSSGPSLRAMDYRKIVLVTRAAL